MVITCLSLLWSFSVWESWQQFGADLQTTILAILNSCQSFGTVPMQRLASEIGKLRQFAQLFAAIPTLLVAIRHHATLPRAICRNRQNGPSPILQCIAPVWKSLSLLRVLWYDSPKMELWKGIVTVMQFTFPVLCMIIAGINLSFLLNHAISKFLDGQKTVTYWRYSAPFSNTTISIEGGCNTGMEEKCKY